MAANDPETPHREEPPVGGADDDWEANARLLDGDAAESDATQNVPGQSGSNQTTPIDGVAPAAAQSSGFGVGPGFLLGVLSVGICLGITQCERSYALDEARLIAVKEYKAKLEQERIEADQLKERQAEDEERLRIKRENVSLETAPRATVVVLCGKSRGSGAFISKSGSGIVLTAGSLVTKDGTTANAADCKVGFPDSNRQMRYFFNASLLRAVYKSDEGLNFAVLRLKERVDSGGAFGQPAPMWITGPVASAERGVWTYGYSERFVRHSEGGVISTDTPYLEGNAEFDANWIGGPVLNRWGELIGINSSQVSGPADLSGLPTVGRWRYATIDKFVAWYRTVPDPMSDTYLQALSKAAAEE